MPERFRLNTSREMIQKMFTPPGENNVVSGWMGFDVPVAQKPPLLDRVQLPDPNPVQAEQLARNAFNNPDNDLAALVQVVAEVTTADEEFVQLPNTEILRTSEDVKVVFSATELIKSNEQITEDTIAFVSHLRPDFAVVDDDGEQKVIVQSARVISETFNGLRENISPVTSPVSGDLD